PPQLTIFPYTTLFRSIQPIFKASCLKCHGPEKPKGQFRLDSKSLAMKGGVAGKAILPGKGAESPLVRMLLLTDPDERMPRKADRSEEHTSELQSRFDL